MGRRPRRDAWCRRPGPALTSTYLVDSSAWIEYLRATGSPANTEVRRLLRDEPAAVATTEPVIMELLAGATDDRALDRLDTLTAGLPLLTVDATSDYRDAALVYRSVRRRGGTVRKLAGCLIGVVAARTGAVLVHRDRDLESAQHADRVLAAALPDLRVHSLL